MPNPRNPLEIDLDDGIENIPVVKGPVQAVNKVANSGTKYAVKQAKALTKAFVSQLYGASTPAATDDDQQQSDATATDPLAQAKKQTNTGATHHTPTAQQQNAGANTTKTTTTPEEDELAATRRALNQHISEYQTPTFGKIDDVEMDVRKEAQKRKQEEQKKAQEEEDEKQRKAQEAQQVNQQFVAPTGKSRNRMGQPPQKPIALRQAQTKTEINRGSTG